MKVLILGGSGFIGRHLLTKLLEKKYDIRLLTRDHNKKFPKNVDVFFGDIANPNLDSLKLVNNCEVVFNCAGEINKKSKMMGVNFKGIQKIFNSFAKNNQFLNKHWVQLSSVGSYGPSFIPNLSRVVTEETPTNPIGLYEETKTKADEFIINSSINFGISFAILRPSNVVGLEMPNQSFFRLVNSISKGRFFYVNSRKSLTNYVHVEDVVRALLLCGFHKKAKNEIFNLSNDCFLKEIVEQILQVNNNKDNFICLPEWITRFVIRILSFFCEMQINKKVVNFLVSKTSYRCEKIYKKLKFKPSVHIPSFAKSLLVDTK